MNNKIVCIDFVVIVCCAFFVFQKINFLFIYIGNIYLWLSYLIIYYVLSLAKHQDYFNYIWNLKHNRFVIVRLTWMDQIAILRNLTRYQYIRFKTLSSFFFHIKWELCHLVLIAYNFSCFTKHSIIFLKKLWCIYIWKVLVKFVW
jgi:hypothetical protein